MNEPRILIVEDEALLAADIGDSLSDMGFEVVGFAQTGESAISQASEKTPDLVLMDIQLRGSMDGIEAATKIKAEVGCPIVFQTAYAEDTVLERATAAEPYGYLVKPVGLRELHATIKMALYKAKIEAEREKLLKELQEAMSEIRTLREFLPICAWCKKVRDDKGYWKSIEEYLSKLHGMQITHGMCPSCLEEQTKLL
jgi:two-component system, response regulator PdtaR